MPALKDSALNKNIYSRYKLAPILFWAVLAFCILPSAGIFIFQKFGLTGALHIPDEVNTDTFGKAFFNVWLVLAIGTAVITGGISFVDYYVKRELSAPLVGCILFAISLLDAFHFLIANNVIHIKLDYQSSLYATWLTSRFLYTLFLAVSTWYFIFLNKKHIRGMPQKNNLLITASIVYLIIIAITILWLCLYEPAFLISKYNAVFNYEAMPVGITLLWALFVLPYFHTRYPSIFSRLLVLSAIPAVFADLIMCFHQYPFDVLFNTAYFFRFISYLVPLWGISMNYIETIAKEKSIVYRLDSEIHERLAAQKELEKREALLANAERIAHLGSWEFNIPANELKWSDEMFHIHGYELNAVKPTMALQEEMVTADYLEEVKNVFQTAIRNRTSYNIEYQVKRPSGEMRFLLGQGNYLKKSNKLVGTILDITELKEAQKNLEIKVQELNRSNSELEQFAYVASHDLQEPLRKIKAFGDRLSNKFGNLLPEEGIDYIARMTSASLRMQTLIDDLLTFSRVSRTDENTQEVRLGEIISGVINDLEVAVEKKNARIGVFVDHNIEGIPGQIRQLFQNLLSNALKFSKADQSPDIIIRSGPADPESLKAYPGILKSRDYCRITVQDNGIGFDKEYAQKIFILFQRLHTRNEYEGTGIGLAVCKKIVDNHHGHMLAESEENVGTTFIIYLPCTNSF